MIEWLFSSLLFFVFVVHVCVRLCECGFRWPIQRCWVDFYQARTSLLSCTFPSCLWCGPFLAVQRHWWCIVVAVDGIPCLAARLWTISSLWLMHTNLSDLCRAIILNARHTWLIGCVRLRTSMEVIVSARADILLSNAILQLLEHGMCVRTRAFINSNQLLNGVL